MPSMPVCEERNWRRPVPGSKPLQHHEQRWAPRSVSPPASPRNLPRRAEEVRTRLNEWVGRMSQHDLPRCVRPEVQSIGLGGVVRNDCRIHAADTTGSLAAAPGPMLTGGYHGTLSADERLHHDHYGSGVRRGFGRHFREPGSTHPG